jgi:hypothetical protein
MERIMDALDQTDLIEEHLLGKYLEQNNRIANAINVHGSGECLSCGYEVEPMLINGVMFVSRWCSIECRNYWDNDR